MAIQNDLTENAIRLGNHMEKHVAEAFRIASALASRGEISAADLLSAVMIVLRRGAKSKAFSYLESLLPLDNLPEVSEAEPSAAVRLYPGLAESYPIAQHFFSMTPRIWGRDLVTFALLADSDPSLNAIAHEANTNVDDLQDAWFVFVTSTEQHRKPDDWADWWKQAGVPAPEERASTTGSTYLFTWNPDRFPEAEIEKHAEEITESGSTVLEWSTDSRRHVSRGERVFLLRQDVGHRGLVGSGQIEGEVQQRSHWDPKEREQGNESWMVLVRWDTLSIEPIVTEIELTQETGEEALWRTRVGGVKVTLALAGVLEILWSRAKVGSLDTDEFRFAQTLSDLDHRNDWIGIRADVEALSTLVAVNRVEPPLSIAIFGDWGSGKTFLMQKMQERVQLLEQIGKTQEVETIVDPMPTRYCSSILQVEFNAWHYTESNLWASLVNHILEKLHGKLTPEDKDAQHTGRIEEFFEQFEIARAAREVAEKQVQLISAEVERAEGTVTEEEANVGTASNSLAAALGRSVWAFLDQELGKNGEDSRIYNALKHFGFEESLTSAQTVYDTVGQFRSVSGRAHEVAGSLLTTRRGVYGAIVVALVVLLATIGAAILKVPLMSVGATLTGVLAWLADGAASARKPLEAIQAFDEWFSKIKQEEESRIATALAEAQAEYEQRREVLSLARRQLAEAEMREARAKDDLKQLTARDQMRRFVDERVTTQTYAKHLGIISMIRQDFEDLSDFMYRDRQPGEARLVERVSQEVKEAIPTVERIILYIDDLDRCQPARVVEVLEAIHLLLAFRLFVVVVAVDPRWVLESLRQRYPHLSHKQLARSQDDVSLPQNGDSAKDRPEATAHDYLEKIFHIPFWVKPIGPQACKSLIAGYLGYSESATESPDDDAQREIERFHDLIQEPSARQSSITERLPVRTVEDAPGETTQTGPRHSEQTIARQTSERAASKRRIEHVEIIEREQKFIRELAPYLGNSPRRIKRYANTYRLLKSGLTRREARLFAASNDSNDDYQIVLVFLAVVTGAPSLAPQIFSKAFELRGKFNVGTLVKEAGLEDESVDRIEATNAKGALELLTDLNISQTEIETWVPRVMRYAFRLTPINLVAT